MMRRIFSKILFSTSMLMMFLSLGSADVCRPLTNYAGTPHDAWLPNFADPTKLAGPVVYSAQNGAWSQPSTWQGGVVPGPSNVVVVNHDVTYDSMVGDVHTVVVYPGARLRFRTDMNTRLRLVTLQGHCGSTIEIGTESDPILAAYNATIIIKDVPFDTTIDPAQYGHGIVIQGTFKVHGAQKNILCPAGRGTVAGKFLAVLFSSGGGLDAGRSRYFAGHTSAELV
jgi:hypothetical protein